MTCLPTIRACPSCNYIGTTRRFRYRPWFDPTPTWRCPRCYAFADPRLRQPWREFPRLTQDQLARLVPSEVAGLPRRFQWRPMHQLDRPMRQKHN